MRKFNSSLMRSISVLLIFSFLLSFILIIPKAEAADQVICTYIGFGYCATWNVNGQWYADFGNGPTPVNLGGNYNSMTFPFKPPVNSSVFSGYTNVHPVVTPLNITDSGLQTYINAVIANQNNTYGVATEAQNCNSYQQIHDYYLNYEADNCTPTGSMQSDYSVNVKWNFNISPISGVNTQAIDLKSSPPSWLNAYYTPTWTQGADAAGFNAAKQAYLWSLPVMITWEGTPTLNLNMGFANGGTQIYAPTLTSGTLYAGQQAGGYIYAENYTCYETVSLNGINQLRVYTWVQGQAPQLQNSYNTDITGLQSKALPFTFTVPSQPFTLILTLNEDIKNLNYTFSDNVNTDWNYDPMSVWADSGEYSNSETTYADNKVETQYTPQSAPSGGGSSSNQQNSNTPSNIVADSVNYDTSSNTATFTCHSNFSVGGYVNIRFFDESPRGTISEIPSSAQYVHLNANGQATITGHFFVSQGDTLIATVDNNYSGGWQNEQFKGDDGQNHNETTWSDNDVSTVITAASSAPPPSNFTPDTTTEYHPASYYPVITVPQTQTITTTHTQDHWQPVPIHFAPKPKIHTILVN